MLFFYSLPNKINKRIVELGNVKGNSDEASNNTSSSTINRNAEYLSYIELLEKKQNIEKELILNTKIDFIETNSPYVFVNNKSAVLLNVFGFLSN